MQKDGFLAVFGENSIRMLMESAGPDRTNRSAFMQLLLTSLVDLSAARTALSSSPSPKEIPLLPKPDSPATAIAPALAPEEQTQKIAELESAIAALLAILESRLSRGELTLADPIITLACEHIDQAIAIGVEQEYSTRLAALLSAIAPPPSTSRTPRINGVVLQPVQLPMITAPERRQQIAPSPPAERRSGREGRRFKRFAAPVLLVWIGGQAYRTVDWSIGGLCLAGALPELAPGTELLLRLRVESLPGHPSFEDRALMLRSDGEPGRFRLCFKSGTSATLKVLELLSRVRITPAEAPH